MNKLSDEGEMRETPETDAEGVRFARVMIEWPTTGPTTGESRVTELIPAEFARRLERERDEARKRQSEIANELEEYRATWYERMHREAELLASRKVLAMSPPPTPRGE